MYCWQRHYHHQYYILGLNLSWDKSLDLCPSVKSQIRNDWNNISSVFGHACYQSWMNYYYIPYIWDLSQTEKFRKIMKGYSYSLSLENYEMMLWVAIFKKILKIVIQLTVYSGNCLLYTFVVRKKRLTPLPCFHMKPPWLWELRRFCNPSLSISKGGSHSSISKQSSSPEQMQRTWLFLLIYVQPARQLPMAEIS